MKASISKKKLREFGIFIGFGFPLFIGWVVPSLAGHGFRLWTLWVGGPVCIIGMTLPLLLYYPYKSWIALGNALGWFNSKIIFGLIFIFILQPIALIMRFIGYDPLRIKRKEVKTYRENRKDHQIDFTRIF